MSIEPTLTPAPTFSPTDELSACTDINVAQYVMCGVDHIAICYQHGDHLHNKCVSMYNNDDIFNKRPGIDYYKDKYLLINCGCCEVTTDENNANIMDSNDVIIENPKISYPKDYDNHPYCDYITSAPSVGNA